MNDTREKLGAIEGERKTFTGVFERFGRHSIAFYNKYARQWISVDEKTILLVNVKDESGTVVADHLWFRATKGFLAVSLKEGDAVSFAARVKPYLKGYVPLVGQDGQLKDWKLANPTKITVLKRAA